MDCCEPVVHKKGGRSSYELYSALATGLSSPASAQDSTGIINSKTVLHREMDAMQSSRPYEPQKCRLSLTSVLLLKILTD